MTISNRIFRSQNGISIIGAIFTLIILGIFGATIVVMVATEHETRRGQLSHEWSFYNVQAGLEYALREIDRGGYPIVSAKTFGYGNFTVQINYDEVSVRDIIASAVVGDVSESHQISYDSFGGDCLLVDYSSVALGGFGSTNLEGVTVRKTCNEGVNIDKILAVWAPDSGEKINQIILNGVVVWEDIAGAQSGATIDIVDTLLNTSVAYEVNLIRFTSNMSGKEVSLRFIMTDSSTETVSFMLP